MIGIAYYENGLHEATHSIQTCYEFALCKGISKITIFFSKKKNLHKSESIFSFCEKTAPDKKITNPLFSPALPDNAA